MPRFITDISNAAAREWMAGLFSACDGAGVTQDCIFSDSAQSAMSRAQAEESKKPHMQRRFEEEMAYVVLKSPEFRQAILDYEALEREYRESRVGRRE
jgi:hypothetical protein